MVKRDQWEKKLRENKPKVLFLTARHPIQRLISVWNQRFCFGTCSSDQDRKYAKQSLEVLQFAQTMRVLKDFSESKDFLYYQT